MGLLSNAYSARYGKQTEESPGSAVLIKTEASRSVTREIELYHPPGLVSSPTREDRVIETRIGAAGRVAIGTHNYRIKTEVDEGETLLYSTDDKGGGVKASVRMKTDGGVEVDGEKTFVKMMPDGTVEIGGDGPVKISGKNIEITGDDIKLNGEGRTLVTHAELAAKLKDFALTLSTHTHSVTGVTPGTAAIVSGPPVSAAKITLEIPDANAASLKTG